MICKKTKRKYLSIYLFLLCHKFKGLFHTSIINTLLRSNKKKNYLLFQFVFIYCFKDIVPFSVGII